VSRILLKRTSLKPLPAFYRISLPTATVILLVKEFVGLLIPVTKVVVVPLIVSGTRPAPPIQAVIVSQALRANMIPHVVLLIPPEPAGMFLFLMAVLLPDRRARPAQDLTLVLCVRRLLKATNVISANRFGLLHALLCRLYASMIPPIAPCRVVKAVLVLDLHFAQVRIKDLHITILLAMWPIRIKILPKVIPAAVLLLEHVIVLPEQNVNTIAIRGIF
jgi:hypothetical protein